MLKIKSKLAVRVKLAFIFTLCLPVILFTKTALALDTIGTITINGEPIRPILFKGYSQHVVSKDYRCPPISDYFIKNQVITYALVVFDGRKKGLEIPESDQRYIEKYKQELEQAGPDGDASVIAQSEILMFTSEYGGYIDHYPAVVTHEQILEEYKRLINIKDPRFTDVKLIRRTPIELRTAEDATEAKRLLESGATLADLEEKFEFVYAAVEYAAYWTIAYKVLEDYRQYGDEFRTGAIIRVDDRNLLQLNEVKHRSRLRPFVEYQNSKDYVYTQVKWDLLKVRKQERNKALWAAAEVLENGEPIEMTVEFPQCGG